MALPIDVQVEIDEGRLVRVRIPNGWRASASVSDLGSALSAAIRQALPVPEHWASPPESSARPGLSVEDLAECMAMHRAWRTALTDVQRRDRAGEFADDQPAEVVDAGERVSVTFAGGRFDAIHLRPDWAEHASVQAICDRILAATVALDLVRPDRYAAALRHVRDLDADIRRFAS